MNLVRILCLVLLITLAYSQEPPATCEERLSEDFCLAACDGGCIWCKSNITQSYCITKGEAFCVEGFEIHPSDCDTIELICIVFLTVVISLAYLSLTIYSIWRYKVSRATQQKEYEVL